MSQGRKAAERLSGKTIFITGASAGIGHATAVEYMDASNGEVKLILTARRLQKLQTIKDELLKHYPQGKIFIAMLDVSQLDTIEPFLKSLPDEFKDIDILVNNAGKALGSDLVGNIDVNDIKGMMDTNVLGLINITQVVLKNVFQKKNSGDIVNIGSVAGRDAYPTGSIYCASKFAVRAFTESLRRELINTKIRVILIAPGIVETEFSMVRYKGDTDRAKSVYEGVNPLLPEDVADLIVYTTSRKSNTVIADTLIFPTSQGSAFHVSRETK
ncbi:oxidoreductase NDAI_0K01000 [Naumovozyma dairenensis CBS 421]|uniref:Uncharacterized protein n=1 Tax=Naumovozyma dairenensis (strain ATCC 10597 / BCRC 20456 / CBS 421 / NBRC 0211 / NRRL Y-12639) TaxID=1071378 RepID=G0WHN0_NAUDC|nr:hypothetical protein NDAI_0K01000 [Naumovozyma dairenensis CBS 421]CCD27291.1 hypothetical protein NDAI_0K01000 [Naumovozyma dairenensis CBS 421]